MRTMICALGMLFLCPVGSANAQTELECLTEAVLAESTLAKEPIEADSVVGYSIYRHSQDGRWGSSICQTIGMRYAHTGYRKVKVRSKKGRKTHFARKAYTYYVWDYSYKGKPYYRDIVKKSRPEMVERARLVAQIQLAGLYEPPEGFEQAIDFIFAEKSSERGKLWFSCTGVPLGKVDPRSVHVMYREGTDGELTARAADRPECRAWIRDFIAERTRNLARKQSPPES